MYLRAPIVDYDEIIREITTAGRTSWAAAKLAVLGR